MIPRTEVRLPGAVPGWAVRATLPVLAAGSLLLVAGTGWQVGLAGAAALFLAWRPQAVLVGVTVAMLVVTRLLVGPADVDLQLHALVLLVPALVRSGALADQTAWTGAVDRRVLARAGRRLLTVQLGVQPLALVAGALDDAGPQPWLGVVAVAALGGLGWWAGRRALRPTPEPAASPTQTPAGPGRPPGRTGP